MFGRTRSPEAIRESALEVGARKLHEGCSPCADAYFRLAEQNSAAPEQVQQARMGRRAILARAGLAAGALSALSLADPAALMAAPGKPTDAQPKLEPVSAQQARALYASARRDSHVSQLDARARFSAAAELTAYRVKDAGNLVTRTEGDKRLVAILAGGAIHAALYVGDDAYSVTGGAVREDIALTGRFRELQRSALERTLSDTVAHMLSPAEADAACPACAALIGACALGAEACRRGCAPCCGVAAGACLAAMICCAAPG